MPKKTKKKPQKEEKIIEKPNFDSQTKFVLIFMAILILVILFTYLAVKESKKFSYLGVTFYKNDGRCPSKFYLGEFPLGDNQYLKFCFRQDPRNINITIESPIFLTDKVALAMDSSYSEKCEDSIVSATTLSVFLNQLGASAYGATINKTEALALNRTYVNCSTTLNSIVVFRDSQVNLIKKQENCYIVEIKDCGIMNATERFMIGMWASSKGVKL
ncbi:MAG: hypothetical protein NT076_03505 [Candidatus Pacearchaeota archaeon]|nr:hypothetical protein [Candidatus Pacearchaeota archaeon]